MLLTRFLEQLAEENWFYAVKRLSGNDTGLTGGHQAGIYMPRWFFEGALASICRTDIHNPRETISEIAFPGNDCVVHGVQAIYYNSKFHPELGLKKKYDEFRLTGWGGRGSCPFQEPDNTGALVLLAINLADGDYMGMAWVSSSEQEDETIESWIGYDVLPGEVYGPLKSEKRRVSKVSICLADRVFLPEWKSEFPTGNEIFQRVVAALPSSDRTTFDQLLLKRRELEFAVFARIEEAHVLPQIQSGFLSVDEFISYSLGVANRRKSRTGKSLELNLAQIFRDAELTFAEQGVTENRKKPDFLFPSQEAYNNDTFPSAKLHMMAAKTCCKDRWRQVLNEADRIPRKHLFTLQEGISVPQFAEMTAGNLQLVVPESNKKKFPLEISSELSNLESFVSFISSTQNSLF
ncbi:MAG: type II restriction endonuclease [Kiritimatiellales bacterium]|nr:type II restriction endonuclease [Kiritimatiellales bacterium]